jgi:flagellar basal-body rod modification protein FlgD
VTLLDVNNTLNQIATQTAKVQYEQGKTNLGSGKIDQQGFLKLLMAQLKSQDPMAPVDDAQFVSQQAAFAQVEKLDNLSKSLDRANNINQASSLIGKTVELNSGINPANGSVVTTTGKVDSVLLGSDGTTSVVVGGKTYDAANITKLIATQ